MRRLVVTENITDLVETIGGHSAAADAFLVGRVT